MSSRRKRDTRGGDYRGKCFTTFLLQENLLRFFMMTIVTVFGHF